MNSRKGKREMSRAKLRDSRPTIGLLSEAGTPYDNALWAGLAGAAPELDVNLIFYVGGAISASEYGLDAQRNVLYDLVSGERVDGLIICATIGNFITTEEFRSFVDRYRPLPMVGIAQTPGIPCVAVDNEKGMRDIVTHFIEVHGYRRIAFICGPENNEEAALRYRAYVDVLAEHDLPLDPDLVAPGAFIYETGIDAIHLLLDERKVRFEAVVAANDWMAFGVLKALEDRGIRVPDDVALGGFDDTREAAASRPSLTTVRQPIHKLGQAGIEVLLKLLAGEQVPEQTMLPTRLVVRQSCGCSEPVVAHAAVGPLKRRREPLQEVIAARREEILSEMVQVVGGSASSSSEWAGRLLDAFLEEIASGSVASKRGVGETLQSPFLSALDDVLRQAVAVSSQVDDWQEAISVMRRHLLPYLTDVATLSRVEDLFSQGRVMVSRMAQWNWARQEVEEARRSGVLSYLSGDLVTAVETEQIIDVLGHRLPQLGFSTFYLSFYDGQERPAEWSRLVLAYDRGERVELGAGGWRFPTRHLVPDELFPQEGRYAWVVESLTFRENQFGCVILKAESQEGEIYRALARQISGALQDSLLLQRRRRAEEALRQLKEFNEGIVQGMEEGIIIEDAEGYITFVNPKMAETLGYTEQELVGKHWSETIAPSCLSQVEEESSKRPKGISSRYETVLLRKDGNQVPGLISASPLFGEGEFAGTLAVFTDLTEIKEMEQQLIQAGKLAAIGQLVAGVAHELNNPLTSVVGYSQLLMAAECSEEIKRDLERINRQGVRAARIVENLLTFARRREPRKESININDVVERSLELQGHQLELDRISIVKELDQSLPPTMADPFQMQQVFMNIIGNAHRALRDWEGNRRLRVRSELAGDMIHVEFADSGPGIPAEVMERLFEPFFTTKEVGQGTGLGLSISYGIVEAHRGRIWAESEVGKGTTFRVRLPISVG